MTLCISLSARPSNNGTRFHNHLYDQLDLNWIYKAFAPTDLAQAIAGVRGLGIRGCAVSMPYKEDVIALVDELDPSAKAIDSVNTIVNTDGHLKAYNTDYTAIEQLLATNAVPTDYSVLVQGAGGMAKATVAALRDAGFTDVTVIARNEDTGPGARGPVRLPVAGSARRRHGGPDHQRHAHWHGRAVRTADSLSFPEASIAAAKVVFDVVALPAETPLIKAARAAGKAGHHRRGGGHHPGAGAVCPLHGCASHRRAGPGRRGVHARPVGRAPRTPNGRRL